MNKQIIDDDYVLCTKCESNPCECKQDIADNFTACPACQNIFSIEHEIKPALVQQKAEYKKEFKEWLKTGTHDTKMP